VDRFTFLNSISGFGEVFLSTNVRTGEKVCFSLSALLCSVFWLIMKQHQVAIKKMQINKKNREEYLAVEIGIMKTCQHENIVRFIDSYQVDDIVWVCSRLHRDQTLRLSSGVCPPRW